jgi:hypothetical protein
MTQQRCPQCNGQRLPNPCSKCGGSGWIELIRQPQELRPERRRCSPISMRLEPEVVESWRAAAAEEGCTLTEWLERAARQRIESAPEVREFLQAAWAVPRPAPKKRKA